MKAYKKNQKALFVGLLMIISLGCITAQNATEIVRRADAKLRGEKSSFSIMTMQIVRPSWERSISFKTWTKGTDLSLVLITSPKKESGQTFLKRQREMWNWNPTISRMIKLPPSMLSQGWMGSDFTNDDLLNQSSIVVDYTHKIIGEEKISGRDCYKIELLPKENAPVVWGKIITWISKSDDLQLKNEYYDEDGYLVKTEIANDIKSMDDRVIPTHYELIPADEPDQKTIVVMENIKFNIDLNDSFFSQQNMKRVR